MNLNESLHALTTDLVKNIIEAVGGATLEELAELGGGRAPQPSTHAAKAPKAPVARKTSRLPRRTLDQIVEIAGQVVKLLRSHKGGLRSEEIRKTLDLDRREIPRVLKQAIDDKMIAVLSGQKRSTVYGIKGSKTAKRAAPKKVKAKSKKAAPKSVKRKARKPAKAPKKAAPPVASAAAAAAAA
jgi:hypothetical protein